MIDDVTHAELTGESPSQRANRQLAELLQELRVVQMGVQILLAFLLAIPFQARFLDLGTTEKVLYTVAVVDIAIAMILLMTPVALHRAWFERGLKPELIQRSTRLARAGMGFLALGLMSALVLVLEMMMPWVAAIALSAVLGLCILWFWLLLPICGRPKTPVLQAESESQTTSAEHPRSNH